MRRLTIDRRRWGLCDRNANVIWKEEEQEEQERKRRRRSRKKEDIISVKSE